jgi:hypothetical protein
MKKESICGNIPALLALALLLCLSYPGGAAAETKLPVGDIGRTLSDLVSERPDFEYGFLSGPGFAWTTYGEPKEGGAYRDGDFGYVFFGTHYVELEAVASKYGDKLRCAGVASTLGAMFPGARDGVKTSEFLSSIGVKKYEKYDGIPDTPEDAASLFFRYGGKDVVIIFTDVTSISAGKTPIDLSYPAVMTDSGIEESNRKLCDAFYNGKYEEGF